MRIHKATREQLKRHNRQLLLRAIYSGLADHRAALANETGLAKPTVSDLIAEMIDDGFLIEGGRGESTDSGGKRPTIIKFVPEARQIIGVSLDDQQVFAILSNLDGKIVAQHCAPLNGIHGDAVIDLLNDAINGLIAQLDAPLLCIGVGVPGDVQDRAGVVIESGQLGWSGVPLAAHLRQRHHVPVYVGNCAELTALAQYAFGTHQTSAAHNLVTVLVDKSIEIGLTMQQGAYHHGRDISGLKMGQSGRRLDSALGWEALQNRVFALRQQFPDSALQLEALSYLHIRYCATNRDSAAIQLYDELSSALADIFGWVIGLLCPDHITLAGEITHLGEPFLAQIRKKTAIMLPTETLQNVTFSLAYSDHLSANGAVALALQSELDIL